MMTNKSCTTILTAFLAVLCANLARADDPVSATEHIDVTIAQNQPLELIYPNIFDLDHAKVLDLKGVLAGPTNGSLAVRFDWFDAAGEHFFSPIQEFPFIPGGVNEVNMTFTIPFCPPQVSVDFRLADAPVVRFVGDFTHTCLVPEPTSVMLVFAWAAITSGLCRTRRKR